MKRFALIPLAALVIVACQDATQPLDTLEGLVTAQADQAILASATAGVCPTLAKTVQSIAAAYRKTQRLSNIWCKQRDMNCGTLFSNHDCSAV